VSASEANLEKNTKLNKYNGLGNLSKQRLERFKKAFEAKWLKDKLDDKKK